jgi:hypothetical protein
MGRICLGTIRPSTKTDLIQSPDSMSQNLSRAFGFMQATETNKIQKILNQFYFDYFSSMILFSSHEYKRKREMNSAKG